ncbi:hypothetical protein, partial [Streptomyces sp. 8N706]|uniref:hypothetical protein n=1 Tax=Streptomyces sp. 8N706 TaxID=3457416 RepID=UPI003FD1A2A8
MLTGALGAGTAAVLLSGCSEGGSASERAERSTTARKLRARAAEESGDLLDRYDATAKAHPGLAERLRPLRAEVAGHATAFASARPSGSSAAASASPSPSASAGGSAGPPASVPEDERKALAALADAERRTADARTTALLEAPPELARLLASVAAAGAAHAYLLTEG